MTDNEYSKTREAAAEALIHWAKTGWQQFTMRDAVNNYLEASGANRLPPDSCLLRHAW